MPKVNSNNKKQPGLIQNPKVHERLNYLSEAVQDDLEQLALSKDEDAKVGHKTADTAFFGCKLHLAMSEERIITAATVTTGEKSDGKELQNLIKKSIEAGMAVNEVIGDAAYSEKDNLEYAKENGIKLIAKLYPIISRGGRKKEEEFDYNKDAGMFVCPAGHLAIRKAKQGKKGSKNNQVYAYYFDRARERYKIEAKNSELKHRHGYDVAISSGLIGMRMQAAITIFAVNIKRIIKLKAIN